MVKNIVRYFDFGFYLRFVSLFLFFYITYTFVVAASVPTGVYYPFVEHYLNFPALIRDGILATSKFFLTLLGYQTVVSTDTITSADGYSSLFMAFPCYGLGVKSFWVAFVCAHKMTLRQKITWSLIGVLSIFFVNCLRVAIMMVAMIDKWEIATYLGTNVHDLFNYVCYVVLLGLILLFYKKAKTKVLFPKGKAAKSGKEYIQKNSIIV